MSPSVLVLAGRDPTGGAGVDADLDALRAAGSHGTAVVTNETQQDGVRVHAVEPVPLALWTSAARKAFGPDVACVKTGLLGSREQVVAVAELVAHWRSTRPDLAVVVDPVLAASGGERFLDAAGVAALLDALPQLAPILTPNVVELAELTGRTRDALVRDLATRIEAARELVERGAAAVVAKGGHGLEDPVQDLVLLANGDLATYERPRIRGGGIHGSGCRFASFLAGRVALGHAVPDAARAAGAWLGELIAAHAARSIRP